MVKRRRESGSQLVHRSGDNPHSTESGADALEDWERYPADDAAENIGYQRLAWYAAPFGSTGVALLAIAVTVNGLKALARGVIRLLLRRTAHPLRSPRN